MTPRTAARVCPVLVVFGLGAGTVAAQAGGAAPPPPPAAAAAGAPQLPPGVQQEVEFDKMRAMEPQVRAFADDRFAKLAGGPPEARAAARREIAAAISRQTQPNPLFLTTFGKAVNDAAIAALKGAPPDGRLNVAISVAKVAEPMENTSLAPVVQQLLADEYEPVVLWAVKAAGPVIASNPQPALLQAVSKAVAAQKESGPIADEAYHAVVGGQARPKVPPTFAKQVLPVAIELFRNRIAQYRTALPPDAAAENRATAFFSNGQAWAQMTSQQQAEVVGLMLELATLAADHFATQRDQATPVLKGTGSSLSVISSYVNNSGGQAAGLALSKLTTGTRPEEVKRLAGAAVEAVRAQPPFNQLKPTGSTGAAAAAAVPANGGGAVRGSTTTATAP